AARRIRSPTRHRRPDRRPRRGASRPRARELRERRGGRHGPAAVRPHPRRAAFPDDGPRGGALAIQAGAGHSRRLSALRFARDWFLGSPAARGKQPRNREGHPLGLSRLAKARSSRRRLLHVIDFLMFFSFSCKQTEDPTATAVTPRRADRAAASESASWL